MRNFIKKEGFTIVYMAVVFILIALIFQLFDLPMAIYSIIFWLLFILSVIYLAAKAIYSHRQLDLKHENDLLKAQRLTEHNTAVNQRRNMEEYFIMWVHQMKTPITASKLLLDNTDGEAIPALKQEMVAIENYTNMALNYLKLTNPDRDMTFSQVALDEMIRPLIKKYRTQFIHQQVTLHYELLHVQVVTEANLTSLMIEQILNNALKYTVNGEIWISFDADKQILSIKDTGKGIQASDLPKIFDKGYAGFNGQLNEKSSGLGLYLVQLASQRLQQPVTVASTVGQGSQFDIHFHQQDK
ncbi:sensor histidine kinase [Aerococcus agrisoli]|uniref:histidine kinase n=1 Tax=Aerococcus agrisoli TaxID=2487350 RepID=A0A3N4GSD4_9LACT|nr:sensor histidine kinase [Aerococcus agrisoli]RPA63606.1 sensor histidine kinase [Aerococcus agrisoli]